MGGGGTPANTTQYVTTKQELPAWYQTYLQQVMGQALSASKQPYQQYGGAPVKPNLTAPTAPDKNKFISIDGLNSGYDDTAYQKALTDYNQQKQDYDTQMKSYTDAKAKWDAMTPEQQAQSGQRVAELSAESMRSYDLAGQNVGSMTPWYQQAGTMTQNAANGNINNDLSGYLSAAQNAGLGLFSDSRNAIGQSFGAFNNALGSYDQAADMFGNAAGINTAAAAYPYAQQGAGYLTQAADQSSLASANPYIRASTQPTGLQAASPYLDKAAQSFPEAAASYMNPYNDAVTDRIATLGARNLSEKLLPAVSDDFVRAGQYGSTRQRDLVGKAVRDTQDSILGQQAQALQEGYNTAGQLFGQDTSRYAGLASTAGGLGTAQQQALLGAGQATGSLSSSDLARMQASGVDLGQLGLGLSGAEATDAARQIAAAQGLLGVGQGQTGVGQGLVGAGSALANTGTAQANQALNVANLRSQNQQADYARMLQGGLNLGSLAGQNNDTFMKQLAGLDAAGQAKQNQKQQNLNVAYQDFLTQQGYPWQMIGNLSNVIQGLPIGGSQSQYSQSQQPGPSQLGQLGGLGLGIAGLANSGLFRAKGGAVKKPKPKQAHSYGNLPRRGLALADVA